MTTKLITGTGLQLLRRYDKKAESYKAQLLDDDGPGYVRVFVTILRDIFKEETVEYVLALIDEMLTANPKEQDYSMTRVLQTKIPMNLSSDCCGKVIGSYKRRAVRFCL